LSGIVPSNHDDNICAVYGVETPKPRGAPRRLRALVALLLLGLVLFLGGSSRKLALRLPGLDDRALVYEASVDGTASSATSFSPLLQQRLAAARLSADIRVRGASAEIVIPGIHAEFTKKVLAYRGDVRIDGRAETIAKVQRHGQELHITTSAPGLDGPTGPIEFGPYSARSGERRGRLLVAHCGGDLKGYAECAKLARWLKAPALPPLRLVAEREASTDRLRALSCVLVPIALSLAWLAFVHRFDRAHPEPLALIALVFVAGALGALGAGALELTAARMIPSADPLLFTFGGDVRALPLSGLAFAVLVGLPEEGAKWLAARLAYKRSAFDEPVDGLVYATAASVGFAAAENIVYFASARMSPAVIAARALLTLPAHVLFAGLWGFAAGQNLVRPRRFAVAKAIGLSALLHGAYDACLSTEGAASLALLIAMVLAVLFMTFLRRALRFGLIEAHTVPPLPTRLVPTGSGVLFAGSASAFFLSAAMLFGLGAFASVGSFAPSASFVALLGATFAAFLGAAWAVTRTLPLDVALSARDLVFAGARWPLASITAVVARGSGARSWVHLRGHQGELHLGPMQETSAQALATSIDDARIAALMPS